MNFCEGERYGEVKISGVLGVMQGIRPACLRSTGGGKICHSHYLRIDAEMRVIIQVAHFMLVSVKCL